MSPCIKFLFFYGIPDFFRSREMNIRLLFHTSFRKYPFHFVMLDTAHYGSTFFYYRTLAVSYFLKRPPKYPFMVKINMGKNSNQRRRNNICGIIPAAKPTFHHHNVTFFFLEIKQCQSGFCFKNSRPRKSLCHHFV